MAVRKKKRIKALGSVIKRDEHALVALGPGASAPHQAVDIVLIHDATIDVDRS